MAGAFESGRSAFLEITFGAFSDLLLDHVRRDVSLVCGDATPLYFDSVVLLPSQGLVELDALQPFTQPSSLPRFPIADLAGGQRQGWLRLNEPPFLNLLTPFIGATGNVDIKSAPSAGIGDFWIGYDPVESAPQWASFEAPLRRDAGGHDWDWVIAVDAQKIQSILDRIAAIIPAIHSVAPVIEAGNLELARFSYASFTFHWGVSIRFDGSGSVDIGRGQSSIDFSGHAQFSLGADGLLHLIVSFDDISTDFLEHPFGIGFSDVERAATGDAIRSDIIGAFQQAFGTEPDLRSGDLLGHVESRISDGARLAGRAIEQSAEGLRIFGDAQVQIPGWPKIDPPSGTAFSFYEDPASACAGSEPRFNAQSLMIRNAGDGPLTVCGIALPAELMLLPAPTFPFSLWPGEERRFWLNVNYAGAHRHPAEFRIRISSNGVDTDKLDELSRIRNRGMQPPNSGFDEASWEREWDSNFEQHYTVRIVPSGPAPFRVFPENGVEVLRANSHHGVPRMRLTNCRPVPVREPAAEIAILNDSPDSALYLCSAVLQDPAGVFEVPFSPTMITPIVPPPRAPLVPAINFPPWQRNSGETLIPVYFYPDQSMVDYHALFTLETTAGQIVVPIHGRVEALPQFGDRGEWVDLNTAEVCAPANVLCKLGNLFEPLDPAAGERAIFRVAVDGAPRDSEVVIGDRAGIQAVRDYSRDPARSHDLAFTPLPDGTFAPGDPCAISVRGPNGGDEIDLGDLLRADISGQVIRPEGWIDRFAAPGALAMAGGWVFAATPTGIQILDWRDPARPLPGASLELGPVHALGVAGSRLFAVAGEDLVMFDLARPGKPVSRAEFGLHGQGRALAAGEGAVHVADGASIASFQIEGDRLVPRGRIDLPMGAEAIVLRRGVICSIGRQHLTLLSLDKNEPPRLADSINLDMPGASLGSYGSDLLVSSDKESVLMRLEGSSRLRELARYARPHWSSGFVPDPVRGGMLRWAKGGRLEMWSLRRRRMNLTRYMEALELRYSPQRRARSTN